PLDGLPYFEVEDTLVALGALARARRRLLAPGSPVVAVTGSSGKTSTKEMIRAALAAQYRVHATTGNLNNLVGVPLTLLAAPEDAEALVVEAGASVPGEIARLRDILEPTVAVITNVGYAHVAGFGSLAGVLREKVALLEGRGRLPPCGSPPDGEQCSSGAVSPSSTTRTTRTPGRSTGRCGSPTGSRSGGAGPSRWWWARCWSSGPRVPDCMPPRHAIWHS